MEEAAINTPARGAIATPDFKPAPADIDTKAEHFWGAFGHAETEISAKWLCRMAQGRGDWRPFRREDIQEFYGSRMDGERFTFNRLIEAGVGYGIHIGRYLTGGGWVVERDGLLHFTEDFVLRCHRVGKDRSAEAGAGQG